MIILLKLGGSLITEKTQKMTFRDDVMNRIAGEIAHAHPQLQSQLIIGHGSGSFGHFIAKKYNTIDGVETQEDWRGFAGVAHTAATLNHYIMEQLHNAELPAIKFQTSALTIASDNTVKSMQLQNIKHAITHDLIPVVYGDVAFDEIRGGTIISTEMIFDYLADHLPVSQIILAGEVDGVYDNHKQVIPHITPGNIQHIKPFLRDSRGVDVTGGMLSKVEKMLQIATRAPYPTIRIINGMIPKLIAQVLTGKSRAGTLISADERNQPDDSQR